MLPVDQVVREKALDIYKSFIVEAPAGSGKTTILVKRILCLLPSLKHDEQILAITFTKKAALEMENRVMAALSLLTEEEKKAILKNKLKISTIDAFFREILKTTSISVYQDILSEFRLEEVYEKAISDFLLDRESTELTPSFLRYFDNNIQNLLELLKNMLSKRDTWLPQIFANENNFRESFTAVFQENCETFWAFIKTKNLEKALFFILDQKFTLDSVANFCAEILTTKNQVRQRFPVTCYGEKAPFFKEIAGSISDDILPTIISLKLVAKIIANDELAKENPILGSLMQILKKLAAFYLPNVFQKENACDYIEITILVDRLLGNFNNYLAKFERQVKHLLIDEFQDTSVLQFRIFEKLTNNWDDFVGKDWRSVFLVGDPMQSIYAFRSAKVGLFLKAKKFGFGGKKLDLLELKTNFRSNQKLINWFNSFFPHLFPKTENIALGAIPFKTSFWGKNEENDLDAVVWEEHFPTEEEKLKKAILLIKEAMQNPQNKTVAILGPTRKALAPLLEALATENIPYDGVALLKSSEDPEIKFLTSLTMAFLDPDDYFSFFGVFMAPFWPVPLAEILILNDRYRKTGCSFLDILKTSEHPMIQKFLPPFLQALKEKRQKSLRFLIEKLISPIKNFFSAKIADFFAFLEQEEISHTLEDLPLFEQKLQNFYISSSNSDAKLKIMTIHKAKGLEFDCVMIFNFSAKERPSGKNILVFNEFPKSNAGFASDVLCSVTSSVMKEENNLYDYVNFQNKLAEKYEKTRLLYVAATRARRSLYLLD